jgi:hypothetical protein
MNAQRTVLLIVGIILILSGLTFFGQGEKFVPTPSSSMYGNPSWVYYGLIIAVIGVVLAVVSLGWKPRAKIPAA